MTFLKFRTITMIEVWKIVTFGVVVVTDPFHLQSMQNSISFLDAMSSLDGRYEHGQADRTAHKLSAKKLSTLFGQLTTVHICDWLIKVKQVYEPSFLLFHGYDV